MRYGTAVSSLGSAPSGNTEISEIDSHVGLVSRSATRASKSEANKMEASEILPQPIVPNCPKVLERMLRADLGDG